MARVILADVPGLSPDLLARGAESAPLLAGLAAEGGAAPLAAPFPALTCPLHAAWTTGLTPRDHGVTANGWPDRQYLETRFWSARTGW